MLNRNKGQFKCIPKISLVQEDIDSLFKNKMRKLITDAQGQAPDVILEHPPIYLNIEPYAYVGQLLLLNNDYQTAVSLGTNTIMVSGVLFNPVDNIYYLDHLRMIKSKDLNSKIKGYTDQGWLVKHLSINPPMSKEERANHKLDLEKTFKDFSEDTLESDLKQSIVPKVGFHGTN